MNKLIEKDVVQALQENQSLEADYGSLYYYLHVREDGKILYDRDERINYSEVDRLFEENKIYESFRVEIELPEEIDDIQDWHDTEDENNKVFMEAVKNLMNQANNWLANF